MFRLDHVALRSHDVRATHHFYSEVLGLAVAFAFEWKDGLHWAYDLGGGHLLVFQSGDADERHVGLTVSTAEERDRWRKRFFERGIRMRIEDPGPQERLYVSDPDGVVLEIEMQWPPPGGEDPGAFVRRYLETHSGGGPGTQ
jgi:catechol 2,3-dioxygenase-like lactoylglutathione lyase family enzyme